MHLKSSRSDNEDDIVNYRSANANWLLLCLILLCGCATQMPIEDLTREWIARPLAELKQEMKSPDSYASKIGWKDTTYPLPNGNYVYIQPVSTDCYVHWEVNQGGTIIGYRAKGNGCKQEESDNNNISNIQIRSE